MAWAVTQNGTVQTLSIRGDQYRKSILVEEQEDKWILSFSVNWQINNKKWKSHYNQLPE